MDRWGEKRISLGGEIFTPGGFGPICRWQLARRMECWGPRGRGVQAVNFWSGAWAPDVCGIIVVLQFWNTFLG